MRSQLFDIYRSIFNAIGLRLAEQDIIADPQDIHYLSIEEITKLINANSITLLDTIKPLVELRKKMLKVRAKPFRAGLGAIQSINLESSSINQAVVNNDSIIKGEPCSGGKVQGIIGEDILVISHIDPGMIVDLVKYKGLIILAGGLLSHGAIIARELGIPAVINITGKTYGLKIGAKISLDADSGIITML